MQDGPAKHFLQIVFVWPDSVKTTFFISFFERTRKEAAELTAG